MYPQTTVSHCNKHRSVQHLTCVRRLLADSGGNYVIRGAGAFLLKDGEVARVVGRRVLLISDLDDTMIGDDKGTAAFKRYWQREALPRGSRLVYNTGHALDKCARCRPPPLLSHVAG